MCHDYDRCKKKRMTCHTKERHRSFLIMTWLSVMEAKKVINIREIATNTIFIVPLFMFTLITFYLIFNEG